jgi:hypothetical protein
MQRSKSGTIGLLLYWHQEQSIFKAAKYHRLKFYPSDIFMIVNTSSQKSLCLNWYHLLRPPCIVDAHGLKIQGRGYLKFFAKITWGVKAFRKNCLGGSPYFGFYCIFINKCFESLCLNWYHLLRPPCIDAHGLKIQGGGT